MKALRMGALGALLATAMVAGCQPEEEPANTKPFDTAGSGGGLPTAGSMTGSGSGSDSGVGSGGTGTGTGTGTATGSTTTLGPQNCGELTCVGHGACEENEDGAYCKCDEGYVVNPGDPTECIIDRDCIKLRFLEDFCREIYNGPPAVALFFAVDYCSGNAVLPDDFDDLGIEFKVLENGVDIEDNVESNATVIEKEVESYVTLVLDVSDSLTGDTELLPKLTAELKKLVESLEGGDDPTAMSVIIFGKNVERYVDWTTDLGSVVARLDDLEADPQSVVDLVGGMGTSLFEATKKGIHEAERMRILRHRISAGGKLAVGTVVVVTDGRDTSNATLDQGLIDNTIANVISIGISGDVSHAELSNIGRDGSFLSPEPDDWADAFAEITQRVKEYPDRSYLLGYCSSANTGQPRVEVTVEGGTVQVLHTTSCIFDADLFSSDPNAVCTADIFMEECDFQDCGGLTACGACPDSQCCTGGSCAPPSIDPNDCRDQVHLCPEGEVCAPPPMDPQGDKYCQLPLALGEECTEDSDCGYLDAYCMADAVMMGESLCVETFDVGTECDRWAQCSSGRCAKEKAANPFDPTICQPGDPGGRMFETCGPSVADCERGTRCDGVCTAGKWINETCSTGAECTFTACVAGPQGGGNVCGGNMCFWSWDEKVSN